MSDRPKTPQDCPQGWMWKIREAEKAGDQKLADELYDHLYDLVWHHYWAAVDRERAEAREACDEIERNNARFAQTEGSDDE